MRIFLYSVENLEMIIFELILFGELKSGVRMSWSASQQRKRFDVFDFAAADERVEKESAEILGRFRNPKRCRKPPSPLDKYKFLQRCNSLSRFLPIHFNPSVVTLFGARESAGKCHHIDSYIYI